MKSLKKLTIKQKNKVYQVACDVINIVEGNYSKIEKAQSYQYALDITRELESDKKFMNS